MPNLEYPSPQAVTKFGLTGGMGVLGYDMNAGDYEALYQTWAIERGYRLVDLWGYSAGGPNSDVPLFAATFEDCRDYPSQFTQHMIPYDDYQSVFSEQQAQGSRLSGSACTASATKPWSRRSGRSRGPGARGRRSTTSLSRTSPAT